VGSLNLPNESRVYLDAQILIYSVERHPGYITVLRELWRPALSGRITLYTSELSILECLVQPERNANFTRIKAFERTFSSPRILNVIALDRNILRAAAKLRASHASLKTPDSLHLATARAISAEVFFTNDARLAQFAGAAALLLTSVT
jgi:predicted nucleic acid-binding protein